MTDMTTSAYPEWSRPIRDIADFPKPGILFKDIIPLLGDGACFRAAVQAMAEPWRDAGLHAVLGVEARGFILGTALALELGVGFVPVRKPGKLPARTLSLDYALEYGNDRLQIHADALPPGARVIVVDDVLATGGTLLAAHGLAKQLQAEVVGVSMLIELGFLNGRARWDGDAPLHAALVI